MARKRQRWEPGDNFIVPLKDGTFGTGQVVISADKAMDSVICAFSSTRYRLKPSSLDAATLSSSIAILFVTRNFLDSGRWEIIDNKPNTWSADYINFDKLKGERFIGVTIIGSAIVENLLNAFHCLEPWNDFHNPQYLDGLLLSPEVKPPSVMLI